jgi:hypothetical protein
MIEPYYEHAGIQIFHGDCREVMTQLVENVADVIITDPVWPNATAQLTGYENPAELLKEAAVEFPRLTNRVVIHLGADSDPRILSSITDSLPFFRVCWLRYARPHYKGRILYGSDVAYCFGEPPKSKTGRHIISGEYTDSISDGKQAAHPCPRKLNHAAWLVSRFADGLVLDPFSGSGTNLLAAKNAGLAALGIEIEERYCEIAAKRLSQEVLQLEAV